MSKKHGKKQPDLLLGPLPVALLNATLQLELEAGEVVFSAAAQKHATTRHPTDYPALLGHVAKVIADPRYVGDDHNNGGKIELIGYVPDASGKAMVLVAVSLSPDADGRYHVCSCYRIGESKVEDRRKKGFLKIPKSK